MDKLTLSRPEKLCGAVATGTTPYETCPGAMVRDARDVCFTCYAAHGRGRTKVVQNALARNTAALRSAAQGGVEAVTELYRRSLPKRAKVPYVRLHWSGDVESEVLLRGLYAYVEEQQDLRFLLFTRLWHLDWAARFFRNVAPPGNLAVRPSALRLFDAPPEVIGMHGGTSVYPVGHVPVTMFACPGACGPCGWRCWDRSPEPVAFAWHGDAIVRKMKYAKTLRCFGL